MTGLFFADQALLSLFSVGKSTGLVVDLGHTKTGVSPTLGMMNLPCDFACQTLEVLPQSRAVPHRATR